MKFSVLKNVGFVLALVFWATFLKAQTIPTPKSHFGFDIGDEYMLANYSQAEAYFKKVDEASDRVKLVEIGKTEFGRSQPMMIITAPKNFSQLDRYKEISQKLGRAEITEEEARSLAREGKPVVWIDGGLHANEVVGAQQLIETLYQLASRTDEETLKILDEVIILLVHVNPDGMEIMSNWYMSNPDKSKRNQNIPVLYQKYVGHDNNRDFYMNNMSESTNASLQQYVEWLPQIVYNHHQAGPAGTVVAGPPYRDPFNHVFDPLIITSLDAVGAAMINRLHVEDKPGYARLDGSVFSTWWNGGLRTTPYYHNMIGILTEIVGSPSPYSIPLVPDRLIPTNGNPFPVTPGPWPFRRSIDYSVSLNYAILNHAVRHGDELLYNFYKMGRSSIERGNTDTWTRFPKYAQAIQDKFDATQKKKEADDEDAAFFGFRSGLPIQFYDSVYKNPSYRDPRGYILSSDQADFSTAIKFLNALIKSGIEVHKATADFTVGGKNYPKGSYIVKTAQAFRPHVLDMFEPQDHPNDFQYPGGPPIRPYDAAGWTLAYQMGIEADRIMEGFDGPFEKMAYGKLLSPDPASVPSASGFMLDSRVNDSFLAVNDLLKAKVTVYRTSSASNGLPAGSFFVPGSGKKALETAAKTYGVKPVAAKGQPAGAKEIKPSRIGLFDIYGGSMPSGWVRWMMEQFHFDYKLVFPQEIDAGDLNSKYDVILFIGPGMPGGGGGAQPKKEEIPAEYHAMLGRLSMDKSIPQLKSFLENGGQIITVGAATSLANHLKLPVSNALVEIVDGKEKSLTGDKYYIPGSVLEMNVDTNAPANFGMGPKANVQFNNSPVFKLSPDAASKGIKPLAWFGTEPPLRSGWAWGQQYLKNGVTAFEAQIGKGKLYAFGPEITFRSQSHGTFKMLFNGLYK